VDLSDWLLALHLLAAFALVAAVVLFTVLVITSWNLDVPSDVARMNGIGKFGTILVGIGSIGVLLLGIWLAFQKDSYAIWDFWIIAAIVLWAIFAGTGARAGRIYAAAGDRAKELVDSGNDAPSPELNAMLRDRLALTLHLVSVAAVLLLLLDMIFKPGA
jgi:hypothetical protein